MEELSGQRILMYLKFLRYFLSKFDELERHPSKNGIVFQMNLQTSYRMKDLL